MKTNTEINTLVTRVQQRDLVAAELLYDRFAKAMYLVSYRITMDKMTSEDIVQEAFIKVFSSIHQLKEKSKFGGWLKQIVVNLSINAVKKSRHWEELDQVTATYESDEGDAIPDMEPAIINKAVDQLPKKCRTVFCLYLIEEYTHKEVAQMLGIAVSTSKSQYRYALKLLRIALKQQIYE